MPKLDKDRWDKADSLAQRCETMVREAKPFRVRMTIELTREDLISPALRGDGFVSDAVRRIAFFATKSEVLLGPGPARKNAPPDEPQSIEELCDYIVRYASTIAVRGKVEGKWGSHFLTELPAQKAIERALEFVRSGRVPTRMLTQKETDHANATPKEE